MTENSGKPRRPQLTYNFTSSAARWTRTTATGPQGCEPGVDVFVSEVDQSEDGYDPSDAADRYLLGTFVIREGQTVFPKSDEFVGEEGR